MRLSELFGRAELPYPSHLGDLEITGIVTDSRKVYEGCLFLCIRGLHSDGHDHIDSAIQSGARIIVAEQVREACVGGAAAILLHENTRRSAALLYNAWFNNPAARLRIIGVTGTNGKTSVCFLLRELFESAGFRCGILGTVLCRSAENTPLACLGGRDSTGLTTPDPEDLYQMLDQMVRDRVDYVFMEVSSHALALSKVDAISFDTVLFTNLTRDHLDFHGTMEAYFSAKKRLLSLGRRAVINGDDPQIATLGREGRMEVLTCSVREGDYLAYEIEHLGMEGSDLRIRSPKGDFSLRMRIPGDFSVMNGLMAAAVALEKGISHRVIREIFAHSCGVPGRMERVPARGGPRILIDYAHTPDALEKLLMTVRQLRRPEERIFLLFGCGGERDRGKRKEMGRIATRFADLVIVTSDNSRGEDPERILSDILRGIDKEREYVLIPDRREAIGWAVKTARQRDWVLLAGKGHETYEIDGTGRHPFDERVIVKQALEERNAPSAGQ